MDRRPTYALVFDFFWNTVVHWIWLRLEIVRVAGLAFGGALALVGFGYAFSYWSDGKPSDARWFAKIGSYGLIGFAVGAFAQWGGRFFGDRR